ncbi:GNAT family N-acetyltransferase [Candidatus Poribacteria bacterium]|nr:GNAT family N-acetyltransferase [Candidatus Poribacteria bacterium]
MCGDAGNLITIKENHMANQDFNLAGALKVRSAEKEDAANLQSYCFPEKTKTQVTKDLDADLAEDSQTHRLVAEVGGYPIGQISITRDAVDPEVAGVGDLAVSAPFRPLGVADHLMNAAEATAAEDGVKTLEIELPASEAPVIQRYKDRGFTEKPLVVLQKSLDSAPEDDEETAEDGAENEAVDAAGEQQELLDS